MPGRISTKARTNNYTRRNYTKDQDKHKYSAHCIVVRCEVYEWDVVESSEVFIPTLRGRGRGTSRTNTRQRRTEGLTNRIITK